MKLVGISRYILLILSSYITVGSYLNTPVLAVSATGAPPAITDFSDVFLNLVSALYIFVQVVFFIMVAINGFNYMTSGGSPEKAKKARTGLTFTIIGFVLVFVSYLIIGVIATVSGVNSCYSFVGTGNIINFVLQPDTQCLPTK